MNGPLNKSHKKTILTAYLQGSFLGPLEYGFKFAKIFDFKIANFGTNGVNDTTDAKNDP
jgi:hypothetical protein